MQIRGWQLWGANGRPPSNCRRPVARRNLRAVLIGADADLGHDEFHQFRPWRISHALAVCRIPGRGLAAWRPGGIHPCRGLCSACAWHCDLSFAYPPCHSRSDACADSLDLRTCIIASLYGVLHLLREFCVAAANLACRHGEFRRRILLALGRALMSEPQLLMLDEPSLGLAPAVVEVLYDTLKALHRDGLTLLLAEQSIPLALGIADYGYVLQTGRVALEGPAARLQGDAQVQEIYLGGNARATPTG